MCAAPITVVPFVEHLAGSGGASAASASACPTLFVLVFLLRLSLASLCLATGGVRRYMEQEYHSIAYP